VLPAPPTAVSGWMTVATHQLSGLSSSQHKKQSFWRNVDDTGHMDGRGHTSTFRVAFLIAQETELLKKCGWHWPHGWQGPHINFQGCLPHSIRNRAS